MLTRAGVLAAVIVAVGVYGSRVAGSERAVSREPLASLPIEVGAWHAAGDLPIDDESLARARRRRLRQSRLRATVDGAGQPLHRLLRESAARRHDSLAAELPARRRMAGRRERTHDARPRWSFAGRQPVHDSEGPEPSGRSVLVSRTRPRDRQRVRKQALADGRRRAFASYQRIARQGRRSRREPRPAAVQAADGAPPISPVPSIPHFPPTCHEALPSVCADRRDPPRRVQPGSEGQGPAIRRRGRRLRRATQVQGSDSRVPQRACRAAVARRRPLQARARVHGNRRSREGVRVLLAGGGSRPVESRRAAAVGRAAADGRRVR